MTKVIVDLPVGHQLAKLAQPVQLCDPHGNVLGTFMPHSLAQPSISEEELDKREQDDESYSTAEVLSHLGIQ